MSLEEKFAKVKMPNLESQKYTAVVLNGIEETLRDQNTSFTPTAYFAALLALLKQTGPSENASEPGELTTATVYLLDLITSHVPPTLLRIQFSSIVSQLAPYLDVEITNTGILKCAIGCLESLLVAQDSAAWKLPANQISPRQALTAILPFAIDARPK